MFIIAGVRPLVKEYGTIKYNCGHCHNLSDFRFVRISKFFSLFFIPIIPYSIKYAMYCSICKSVKYMTKEEFEAYTAKIENQY